MTIINLNLICALALHNAGNRKPRAMGKKKKSKRKLTPVEKAEKKRRKEMFEFIFINGKQKRVRRNPPEPDYSEIDDPIFFTQNEMWEELYAWEQRRDSLGAKDNDLCAGRNKDDDDELPF